MAAVAMRMVRSAFAVTPPQVKVFRFTERATLHLQRRHSSLTVPVEIGATLKVDLSQPSMMINVAAGENLEQIHLEAFRDGEHTVDAKKYFDIASASNIVSVKICLLSDLDLLKSLRIAMPEKWCTLLLDAGCHDVHIQSVNEANLSVRTAGGNITLGRLRGSKAFINSAGGSFVADMVSAVCKVDTDGGSISVKKLVGTSINVNTGGGGLHVGWLYGDDVSLHTMGGLVDMEHIRATRMASIMTGGGNVLIKGLDGKASIISTGGNIEVQLYDAAEEVTIDSGEGHVALYLSSQLAAKVEHLGTGDFQNTESEPDLHIFESTKFSRRSELMKPVVCGIKVYGSGKVIVRRRSWLESMKFRVQDHEIQHRKARNEAGRSSKVG